MIIMKVDSFFSPFTLVTPTRHFIYFSSTRIQCGLVYSLLNNHHTNKNNKFYFK